jgi:4-hydroxy-tetrahydrodipicolinate synthase
MPKTAAPPSRTFGAVLTAMVTPFDIEGRIDLPAAQALALHLVDSGCDGLVLSGTTGESSTTHQPEKDELVRAVVDVVGERATIVAGAGSNDTKHAVRMAERAAENGADGLLVVTPYYNRPSQAGVYRHMRTVAEATDLPVMLYDIPGRTGLAIADETLDRLAAVPQVRAVKDATGNLGAGFARMVRTGLEFYSGDDALNLPWLAQGASGVVSVVAHIAAGPYAEMVAAVDAGDLPTARRIAASLVRLVDAVMGGGQGAVTAKAAMELLRVIPSRTVRLPLVAADPMELAELEHVLAVEGIL